jgi:hypothetical protein
MVKRWRRRGAGVRAGWERQSAVVREAAQVRQERLAGREGEVGELAVVLFRHDPSGLNFETNVDEYRPEAETIALRRSEARSAVDVRRIVHEEFTHWFGAETTGLESAYDALAKDIWVMWTGPSGSV